MGINLVRPKPNDEFELVKYPRNKFKFSDDLIGLKQTISFSCDDKNMKLELKVISNEAINLSVRALKFSKLVNLDEELIMYIASKKTIPESFAKFLILEFACKGNKVCFN